MEQFKTFTYIKTFTLWIIATTTLVLATTRCTNNIIDRNPMDSINNEIIGDKLDPLNLWRLGRVGGFAVSPDNNSVAYTVTYTDIAEDKNYSDIYIVNVDGSNPHRLTDTRVNEHSVAWTPDGRIAFIAAKDDDQQVWTIKPDGSDLVQVTSLKGGVEGFLYGHNADNIAIIRRVKLDQSVNDIYPDLPKATARIENDLMYRHWNSWSDGTYSHVFYLHLKNGKQDGEPVDLMMDERFDSPLQPFGDVSQIAWDNDDSHIAYTSKKLTGKDAAFSTNSCVYLCNVTTLETVNMTTTAKGYNTNPRFNASDGRFFYLSMEHDGYESDKNQLMMFDPVSGLITNLSQQTDLSINDFFPSATDNLAWVIMNENGRDAIFKVSTTDGAFTRLTNDLCDYTSIQDAGSHLIASRMSMSSPVELYSVDKATGEARNISNVNTEALAKLKMGNIEERWITTTDGKKMLTWVIFPPDFDPAKKYPALLYCQGGPQSTVSQFWSTRWNFQLMAANGYIVIAPNRRGVPGFGTEWCQQISGDYGGQNMLDYFSAVDAVSAEPYVDENRLGAVGASYGGFSVYWLAGHHQKRFKAFIAHCGIFNLEQMYPTTEEMFFVNWDLKGAPWDKQNAAAQKSYANSPHLFVNNWDTPIMVIHGEKDFRIPYTQGMAAFNTAIIKGIEARFLYFPDECHWVQHPQNSILWHREFYKWLDKHLK
ncbi:MAG: S9 family peptidase [Bacteroidales bacterium]|nr:S9 family peptidase [Bacteroidales bacterium]